MRSDFLFQTLSALVGRLPLRTAYAIADVTSLAASLLSRQRAAAARSNFGAVAPQTSRDAAALVRGAFRSHHLLALEFLRASSLSAERLDSAVAIHGLPALREALARGRGAILVTTHVGNWEVLALAARAAEIEIDTVAGVQFHPLVSAAVRGVKERGNVHVHGPDPKRLLRALSEGRAVVLHLDGGFVGRGVDVPLFGRRAWIARGPLVLAARSGAPVLPLAVRRAEPFRFEAEIGGAWPEEEIARDGALLLARELERQVLRAPEQWALFRDVFARPGGAQGSGSSLRNGAHAGRAGRSATAPRETAAAPAVPRAAVARPAHEPAEGREVRGAAGQRHGALRVALVTQSYYPAFGGVSEHVHHLAGALEARGHHVTIVTAHFPCAGSGGCGGAGHSAAGAAGGNGGRDGARRAPRIVRLGRGVSVPFHGGRSHLVVGWGLGGKLRRVLGENRFDVVHAHSPLVPTLPLLALRGSARSVGTFHTAGDSSRYEFAALPLRRLLRGLHAGIAVSEPAREFASRFYEGPLTVIPNGVDPERFHPNGAAPRDGPLRVLCVGRLEHRKGHATLLEAFARLESARAGRAVLIIVGDGPLAGGLASAAARLPRDLVRFTGAVSAAALPDLYRSADLFVAPALRNESFGIVLLEAMASGLPVVASDIVGYRGVLGANASFAKAGDSGDLAAALDRLIEDPGRLRQLAREGPERARRFAWAAVAERVEDLYRDALGRRTG